MPKRKLDETMNDPVQMTEQCTSLCKSILPEDCAFKYDFMISLQKIALAKIITSLWMNGNAERCLQYIEYSKHPQYEKFIKDKISALPLPRLFTTSLIKVFRSVGKSIFSWITYHDKYIFNDSLEHFSVDHISNIKWNSRGKIDYGQTAKNILADKDNCISDEHKYRLACTYCLEDEIAHIAPKVVNTDYLNCVDIEKYPMVYFWTAHITGDSRKFSPASFFNSRMYAEKTYNAVPIRYMWDRLRVEEKSRFIATLIIDLTSQDFRYSLLSTLSCYQQQNLFRKYSGWILQNMFNDWLWEDFFLPTALHVLNIMDPTDYRQILHQILVKIRDSEKEKCLCDQYKYMFKLLWREGSTHMKDLIFNIANSLKESFSLYFLWIHVDIVELVYQDFSAQQKKDLIFSDFGVCANILWKCKFEIADHFIVWCEATPEEITYYKNKLMLSKHMISFTCSLCEQSALPLIIKWCNPSKETVEKLKQIFDEDRCPSGFYRLLDEFIENRE